MHKKISAPPQIGTKTQKQNSPWYHPPSETDKKAASALIEHITVQPVLAYRSTKAFQQSRSQVNFGVDFRKNGFQPVTVFLFPKKIALTLLVKAFKIMT